MGSRDDGNARARRRMVEQQLTRRGIEDPRVLAAMGEVPRAEFVAAEHRSAAYDDMPLPIGEGQTISQPYVVAYMAEALELREEDRVLEVGTGSGYAAAVLGRIVAEVFSVERHRELAESAAERLQRLGYDNVHVRCGDGTRGWPEEAPFDGIMVSAGAPSIGDSLLAQLAPGGRLIIPVGPDPSSQELLRVRKTSDGGTSEERFGAVRFVPLLGEEGW
jgi:protein-L-isoaspartate(D-aspartate) O-methyltransferase